MENPTRRATKAPVGSEPGIGFEVHEAALSVAIPSIPRNLHVDRVEVVVAVCACGQVCAWVKEWEKVCRS